MTPEQRAEHVEIVIERVGDPRDPQNYVDCEATARNIAAAIRAAVLEEREACARIADAASKDHDGDIQEDAVWAQVALYRATLAEEIAASIRGRTKP